MDVRQNRPVLMWPNVDRRARSPGLWTRLGLAAGAAGIGFIIAGAAILFRTLAP